MRPSGTFQDGSVSSYHLLDPDEARASSSSSWPQPCLNWSQFKADGGEHKPKPPAEAAAVCICQDKTGAMFANSQIPFH